MEQLQILIKPVSGACNIACRYCFYKEEVGQRTVGDRGRMGDAVMRCLIKKALAAADSCLFGFQGGEPTLAGLEYYQRFADCAEKERREGQQILYTLQTNGVFLDEAWMKFLKERRFLVGISLDGVRRSHDENRIDGEGSGTFQRVFESAVRLRDEGIPFQVLCVLNRQTASRIEAIYRFFVRKGFWGQQYIPCLELDPQMEGRKEYSLSAREYGRALKALFDLWFQDRMEARAVRIRQFENYVEMLRGADPEACAMYGRCSMQNVIEADGTIYPCDFFATDPFQMGNIRDEGIDFRRLAAIGERDDKNPFFQEMDRRDDRCRQCRWYPLCRGGCKRDCRKREGGMYNLYCEAYQEFFAYAIQRLEYLAALGN